MNESLEHARDFAIAAHAGVARKYTGVPYFTHVERVAQTVASYPGSTNSMVMAAFLHDVVEDTPITLDDLRQEFGDKVVSLVDELTNVSIYHPDQNRAARKSMDIARLSGASKEAKVIKMIDRTDNLYDMKGASEGFRKKYSAESRDLLAAIRDGDEDVAMILAEAIDWLEGTVE